MPAGGNGFEVEVGRTSENFSVDSDISVGSAFVTLSNGEKMFFFDNYHEPSNLEIIYDHSDDPSGDIYYQRVGIDGFKIGTAQVVNISVHHTQDYPKTLQFEDGSFVVAWSQSIGGSTFAAVYQRFDSDGTKLGDENYLTTTDAPSDTISLVPAGGNGFEVEVGRTSENFSVDSDISVGSAFVTLSNGEKMFFFDNYHEPSNLEIIYDHSDDPSGDIYYQRVGIDGFKIGTAQVVNISVHHTQDYPKTLQFEDGSFVVAWSQSIGGSTFAAVYQRFDSDGTKLGDENYLTTTDAPSDTISLVPAGGNGFEVEVGRTSENFSVEDTSNGNPTGSITISGTASEGQVLTVDTSSLADEDGLGALSYQWFANDEALVNLSPVKLYQRFNDQGGIREELLSYKLIGSAHNEDGNGHYAFELTFYKQLDNNIVEKLDVPSQITPPYSNYFVSAGSFYEVAPNTSTLTLTQSEVGKIITTKVSYTDDGGTSESVMSAATSAVTSVNDNPTGTVSITGTATEGQVLTVDTSNLADEDGLAAFSYQWLRGDADITGATSETYTLAQADVGAAISARVSYTDNGGTAESVTSSATGSIINVNDAPSGSITISGTASEGQVLTVDTSSLADEDGLGALSYQWFAKDEGWNESSPVTLYQRFDDELFSYKLIGSANNEDGNGHYAFELTFYKQLDNNIVEKSEVPYQITPPYTDNFVSAGSFYEVSAGTAYELAPNTSTLTLTQSEVGKIITTKVSYTDGGGTAESVTSSATGIITNVNDTTPPMVTLSDGSSLVFFHAPNSFEGLPAGINNFDATPDNSGDVYAQKFTASGTAVAAPFVLNETVFHTQYHPDVLVFGDGSFVVAWSQSQSGNSFAVGYQRFTADGTLDGGEVLLQTSDDPADTKVLEATTGNAFTILIGRTDQTFTVEDTANGNQTDTTPPAIEEVSTSWGSHINVTEDFNDGTVTVTTNGAEGGQTVTVALNAKNYTGTVSGDSAAITIPAADLQALTDGGTYSLTADVSDAAGNAAVQDSSISFDVDKTPPTLLAISATISSGITGITEAGAMVSVVMTDPAGAVNTFETAADATGEWNISAVELMGSEFTSDDNGTYAFFVSATDAAENAYVVPTVNLVVDVEAPAQDVIGGLNIEQLSKAGDVVTYGLIADASYDLGGDGIGALDFAINFDVTNFDWVDGSLTSDYNWSMVLPNETEASSGVVKGGFIGTTKFKDFSDPIAEFQMTVLETSEPVAISITGTSIDGAPAPDTIETFSYMSSTLTATVITRDDTAMDGVTITASDNSHTTDSSGQLSFEVSNGSDVVMDASFAIDDSATSAINSMDALQALRIAVGLDTSNGPATYEDFIAADIDGSGSVNSMDALNILKYAVGLDAPDPHWVFIDSAADHSAIKQTSVNYDTGMTLEGFSADASVSLTGILVGDIDDSYSGLIA